MVTISYLQHVDCVGEIVADPSNASYSGGVRVGVGVGVGGRGGGRTYGMHI